MTFEEILREAREREITREEALCLFQETQGWERALRLFETASTVRDREAGRRVKVMGFICCITRCTTDPVCKYCFTWRSPDAFTDQAVLSEEQVAAAARAIEEAGIHCVELAGGTLWGEEGSQATRKAVEAVTRATDLGVWINNGPAYSPEDVFRFKELGAEGIACNFETTNEAIFKELRPGDNLQARKAIVEATEQAGLGIDNTLMVGLGEQWGDKHSYEDWVDFLFHFKQFNNLKILEIHPFRPMPGSPVEKLPPGSALESAKGKAIARLIFRDIEISGAGDMLGLMTGANLIMHAASVVRASRLRPGFHGASPSRKQLDNDLVLDNYLPGIARQLQDFGMELE